MCGGRSLREGLRAAVAVILLVACGGGGSTTDAAGRDQGLADQPSADLGGAPDLAAPAGDGPSIADGPTADLAVDTAPQMDVPSDVAYDTVTRAGDAAADVVDAVSREGGPSTSDMGAPDSTPANPVCSTADSRGFFASCAACPNRSDCDGISTGGGTRYACGCSGGCPCGLRCGCHDIAPNVRVCNICVR